MGRVLIVDDEQSIRTSLGTFAKNGGHEVSLACDAAEALSLLKEELFDVVVTDIILPRKTGVALLADIREAHPDLQVIMITGEPEVGTAAEAVRRGAFDYLSKPVSREAISSVLERAVAKKTLLDKNRQLEEDNRKHREHLEELVDERTTQLRDSEARYRGLFTHIADPIFVFDVETNRFLDCNHSALDRYGYTLDELRTMTPHALHPSGDEKQVSANIANADDRSVNQYTHITKDGEAFPVEVHTAELEYKGANAWISIVRDITRRKQAEQRTERLLDQQIAINALSLELGEERDLSSIYHTVYEHVSQMMDAEAFIISFFDEEQQVIRAEFLVDEGVVTDVSHFPTIPLEMEGRGTQSQVIHTGEPLSISNWRAAMKETDTAYTFDENGKITDGIPSENDERESTQAGLLVPMKIGGAVIGVLQVQSRQVGSYGKDDEALLAGLANVTAVAIENARLIREIRQALDGTVGIVGDTVEIRDPYTAGHQRRVTELACAIGTRLHLPVEQIEGLRVAGLLHDIGKMAVPTEILSKPTRLAEVEFSLIQSHPQVAYDLLKRIHFQWPVAQIVLQHHERMDGSGYPNGIKSEEILLEARILAVADTVEAMAAHRPYRPALGIDAALEEITMNRGKLYSEDVVDACLQLFAEEEFAFEEQL